MSKMIFFFLFTVSSPSWGDSCFDMGEKLKVTLGIEGEYDPRLRVERKTTNTSKDADLFIHLIKSSLREGERFILRDEASAADRQLVTSTNYPFSKEILEDLHIKVRIREYGERKIGTQTPFTSTTGEYVSLEIKAQLPLEGVVVKPILKLPKTLLKKMFTNQSTFESAKTDIYQVLIAENRKTENISAVAREVLDQLSVVHQHQAKLGLSHIPCENVEYQRRAYVLEVLNSDGKIRKVQLTFDRAITLRENVDPTHSPHEIAQNPPSGRYPPDAVVIEMKTDLWLNGRYVEAPHEVRMNLPTYYTARVAYEKLQETTLDGFAADRGKASHFRRANLNFEQFIHFLPD